MAQPVFTKDTMLDLLVNIIPMGIMAFFIGLFVIWGPFSWDPLYSTLMLGIIGGAFVLLAALTYISAVAIEGDANERENPSIYDPDVHHDDHEDADPDGEGDDTPPDLDHELETAGSGDSIETPETDTGDDGEHEDVF
jgi:hypothetical protein